VKRRHLPGAAVLLLLAAPAARAQELPPPPPPVEEPTTPTPRGAFTRSLLVPGWGQAAFGSYVRGGVFYTAYTVSLHQTIRTAFRLSQARDLEDRWVAAVRDSILLATPDLAAEPQRLAEAIDRHPDIVGVRVFVRSRARQREDWITWTVFWAFAAGVDAYVAAHLADFPADIGVTPRAGGGMDLRVSLPAGAVR
jgi:hypothetical protein